MPNENETTERTVEEQASSMGWVPKEQFRGKAELWIDAEEFVARGEQVMPLLKAANRDLKETVKGLETKLHEVSEMFKQSQEAIAALQEVHSEDTARKVKNARAELLAELKSARREQDVDLEVAIEEKLRELDSAQGKSPENKTATTKAPEIPKPSAAFVEWEKKNPWFKTDRKRQALALGIGQELRETNEKNGVKMSEAEFYDRVAEEVEEFFDRSPVRKADRMEGSGGGSGSGGSGSRNQSYNDLPADAKATCEKQSAKMVGQGKPFKTKSDWQSYYTKMYLES